MSAFRGNSLSGRADPAKTADLDAKLHPTIARQRAASDRSESSTVPHDMLADPDAARAAILAKYGEDFAAQ
jgi:hypothetical protein